jgi:hypothetical protein
VVCRDGEDGAAAPPSLPLLVRRERQRWGEGKRRRRREGVEPVRLGRAPGGPVVRRRGLGQLGPGEERGREKRAGP